MRRAQEDLVVQHPGQPGDRLLVPGIQLLHVHHQGTVRAVLRPVPSTLEPGGRLSQPSKLDKAQILTGPGGGLTRIPRCRSCCRTSSNAGATSTRASTPGEAVACGRCRAAHPDGGQVGRAGPAAAGRGSPVAGTGKSGRRA